MQKPGRNHNPVLLQNEIAARPGRSSSWADFGEPWYEFGFLVAASTLQNRKELAASTNPYPSSTGRTLRKLR
jgi:hypothetical protein